MGRQGVSAKKIMVVDKDDTLCLLYKLELEDEGYEVLVASKAHHALEIVKNEALDLIVMDTEIPDMEKNEALEEIVERKPTVPVIIHSTFPCSVEEGKSWIVREYVVKSSDLRELKNKVSRLLYRCRQGPTNNSSTWV